MRQFSDRDRSSYERNAVGIICRIPINQTVWIRNNGTSEELERSGKTRQMILKRK